MTIAHFSCKPASKQAQMKGWGKLEKSPKLENVRKKGEIEGGGGEFTKRQKHVFKAWPK